LMFDLLIENFNFGYIFWLAGNSALILHMRAPCDKAIPWVPKFDLKTWIVCTRTLIFHMSIPCDTTFSWVQKFVTLTLVLDLLTENCNSGYIFWMICTRTLIFHMSVVTSPFSGFQQVWPCEFDLYVWLTYWKL
jgi:hypothetical protein